VFSFYFWFNGGITSEFFIVTMICHAPEMQVSSDREGRISRIASFYWLIPQFIKLLIAVVPLFDPVTLIT
jgi:hypothetical protein